MSPQSQPETGGQGEDRKESGWEDHSWSVMQSLGLGVQALSSQGSGLAKVQVGRESAPGTCGVGHQNSKFRQEYADPCQLGGHQNHLADFLKIQIPRPQPLRFR